MFTAERGVGKKRVSFPTTQMEVETGRIPQTPASDLGQLWRLSGPWFPCLLSGDDNSHPTDCLEGEVTSCQTGPDTVPARGRRPVSTAWHSAGSGMTLSDHLCSPSSSRELPGSKRGHSPLASKQRLRTRVWRAGEKSSVCESSHIPGKPAY